MSKDDLVTVYTVKDPTQAELVRMALEAEGITAHLDGEGQGGGGLVGIFDTHVVVRAGDADRAREIIAFHESSEDDLEEDDPFPEDLPEDEDAEGIEIDEPDPPS
jgi:hypothetical protein